MTSYRLFPSTNGPATAVSFGGAFLSGVAIAVSAPPAGGSRWFEGFWWWVASNAPTTGVKFALWSLTSGSGGSVVTGSQVTAGTLTASAWNFIPLATPVQLAPSYDPSSSVNGSVYVAAAGFTGNFSDTNSMFNATDTYAAGITNGPLVAYSGTTGSLPAPYSLGQGLFSTAGSDPAVNMPNQVDSGGDGGSNFWIDVQVSDTAPPSYAGSYRLYPNKADTNNSLQGDAAVNYTVGTEVHLLQACVLNKAWYYSQSGAANLATRASVWSIATGLEVAVIASPSWSGAAGAGWISASFAAGTTLPPGNYIVSVYDANGTVGSWAPKDASTNYWGQGGSGGVGSSGIGCGPIFAPPQPSASSGWTYNASNSGSTPPFSSGVAINAQPPFGQLPSGAVDFPQLYAPVGAGTNQTQNYWVDLEVTPIPTVSPLQQPGGRSWRRRYRRFTVIPQQPFAVQVTQGAAALTGSGDLTASPQFSGAAALTGSGTLTAAPQLAAAATLTGSGTLTASPQLAAAAALSGSGTLTASPIGLAFTLTGSGSLTASSQLAAAASLTGSGTLTAAPQLQSSAALTGSGTLTASSQFQSSASLTGSGTLSASSQFQGSAALTGSGTLTASTGAAATLSGSGTLTASPQFQSVAALTGSGALSGASQLSAGAALSGSGTLTAAPQLAAGAGLSGSGNLTASAQFRVAGALSGQGTLTAQSGSTTSGSAALTGSGSLAASAQLLVAAALTGSGTLAAFPVPGVQLAGSGTLLAAPVVVYQGTVALSGSGTLTARAASTASFSASVSAEDRAAYSVAAADRFAASVAAADRFAALVTGVD